ncbi:hypothetical protein Hypma_006257 [Hypsizygus marmoreus]|uniref:Extracellular mutant protein 11 C-terminal domain-containing protein n=1 Tax=Hypsizygus marmoreus TaxID=39966 RepID=A0A369JZ05_HYPMA|nr:hypothetical protein Hypma_006257 [Hypsizygus marmoreus]
MSARMPFIPSGARPVSRAAHPQLGQATNSQFSVDLTNPLHAPQSLAKPPTDNAQSAKNNAGNNANRPLNVGPLMKRKNTVSQGQDQNQNTSRKPEHSVMRPGTADPSSRAHQEQNNQNFQMPPRNQSLSIAAPVPRPAPSPILSTSLATGVFAPPSTQPMFRLPDLPTSTPSDNLQLQKDAHIASSGMGFSFAKPRPASEQQQQPEMQLPSPPNSIRASGTRAFGTGDPPVIPLPPFKINMSMGNQTGPQRILLSADGSRPQEDGGQLLKRANTGVKRSRPETDEHNDDEGDFGNSVKRYRSREDAYTQRMMNTSASRPTSAHSIHSHTRSPTHTPEVDPPTYRQQQQQPLTPPDHEQHKYHRQYPSQDTYPQQHDLNDGLSALDKLLGCSVDAYVEDHAEQYERAVSRWRVCSMAEWVAGADEQAARYAKILDFVKDHMTSKMKLFATFDAKVNDRNAVLEQRTKTLAEVQGRLVKNTANALNASGRG